MRSDFRDRPAPFGTKHFAIPFDATGKAWVRFAVGLGGNGLRPARVGQTGEGTGEIDVQYLNSMRSTRPSVLPTFSTVCTMASLQANVPLFLEFTCAGLPSMVPFASQSLK